MSTAKLLLGPTQGAAESTLLSIYACVCMDMLGQALTISTMPFYVSSFGGDAPTVGLVISMWASGNVAASLWMGTASDRVGRKPMMIFSLVCTAIGFFLTALAWDIRSLLCARLFLGLTSGSLPIAQSYIAAVARPKDRANRLANLGALNGLAVMLGPPIGSAIAASPVGLVGPFLIGGSVSACGVFVAMHNLYSPAEIEALRKFSPAAHARDRWHRLRERYLPVNESAAGRTRDDERWPTIIMTSSVAGLASLLNATPAVVLALGPMERIGLGTEAFGLVLMCMGLCGLVVQLTLFKPLHKRVGLYATGALGGVCSMLAPIAFLCVGSLSPCARPLASLPAAHLVAPPADAALAQALAETGGRAAACAVAGASLVDLGCLGLGSLFFAAGFILCNSCVSPVLVQSASSRSTGKIVGIGAMGASIGRALGPATWGLVLRTTDVTTALLTAAGIACAVIAAWLTASAIDAAEDVRRARRGLPSRRRLFQVVLDAVALHRENVRAVVLLVRTHAFEHWTG